MESKGALRGNFTARIDDKGRLKLPNAFRAVIQERHGTEVFVTSVTGESVRIYAMPVWMALEERLARMPATHPTRLKFLERVNYYGQSGELDAQGRVLIHPRLRDSAGMSGDVDVVGSSEYLDVWNHDRLVARLQRDPFTDEDNRALSEFGV